MVAAEAPQYSVMASSNQHLPSHDLYNKAPQRKLALRIMAFLYHNKFAYSPHNLSTSPSNPTWAWLRQTRREF
jgi:hypothetical protein